MPVLPDRRRRGAVHAGPRGRPGHRDPRHRPEAPTHILLIPRRPHRLGRRLGEADGPLLGRLFAVAADLARSEGIADAGYRLVSNVGRGAASRCDHLHIHLMGGRPFGHPGEARGASVAPGRRSWSLACRARRLPATDARPRPTGRDGRAGMTVSPAVAQTRGGAGRASANRTSSSPIPVAVPASRWPAWPRHRGRSTRSPCRPTRTAATSSSTSSPTRPGAAAAAEQQAYLATAGPVQTPQGTPHVIRQVGPTVVVLVDPRRGEGSGPPDIQVALETLGVGYPVPG